MSGKEFKSWCMQKSLMLAAAMVSRRIMLPETPHSVYTVSPTVCRGFHFLNYTTLEWTNISLAASSASTDPILKFHLACMLLALASHGFRQQLQISQQDAQRYATQLDLSLRILEDRKEDDGDGKRSLVNGVYRAMEPILKRARLALYKWEGVDELGGWRSNEVDSIATHQGIRRHSRKQNGGVKIKKRRNNKKNIL